LIGIVYLKESSVYKICFLFGKNVFTFLYLCKSVSCSDEILTRRKNKFIHTDYCIYNNKLILHSIAIYLLLIGWF